MKKILFISLIFSLGTLLLDAQTIMSSSTNSANNDVVTVLKIKGKVKYAASSNSKFKKVKEGAILSKKGMVKLKKKAKLTLMANGNTSKLKSKGKHALADLSMEEEEDDFFIFLNAASGFGGPGGGAARDTTKKKSSGAGAGDALIANSPIGGKIPSGSVLFEWSGKNADGFIVNLYDSKDISAEAIFSKKSMRPSLMLETKSVDGIQMDKTYYWEVQKTGTEEFSGKIKISFTDASSAINILSKLMLTDDYKESSDWEKALRRAHALQANDLLYNAYKVYQTAMKDFPKNDLILSSFVQMETKARHSN